MSLRELQRALADAIRGAEPVGRGAASSATAERAIAPGTRASADQLETYRVQFWRRHRASLAEDYRSIEHALGAEGFDALARAFLEAHPPARFHLRDLAAPMADFLARAAPWRDEPWLAESARLDWALIEAFDAPDAPPLDAAAVASMREEDWPRARLALHPSVRLVSATHAIAAHRRATRAGEAPPPPAAIGERLVAYRRAEDVWVERVEPAAFALLERLAAGDALGAACEVAAAIDPATEEKLGAWFERWVALGWVVRVSA